MTRAGNVYENPATGERAVIRQGLDESGGNRMVVELFVRPGGAVTGEHLHPDVEETFTVVRGRVGFRLAGREDVASPVRRIEVPPRVAHDWWNAGEEKAHVIVELRGKRTSLERFERMISNLFGLARGGRTDTKGRPNILQISLFALEFDDVVVFARPPRAVQRLLFGALTPVARLLGYRADYPEYGPSGFVQVAPWPARVWQPEPSRK